MPTPEQSDNKEKPRSRDDIEARRLGDSTAASRALESLTQAENSINQLPEEKREKAKQVLDDINKLRGKTDIKSIAAMNNILKMNRELLNSLDPSIVIRINQELRSINKERYREAAKDGNIQVLTTGAMDYIQQTRDIFDTLNTDLDARQQREIEKWNNDRKIAQLQERVKEKQDSLNKLYTNLGQLQWNINKAA